METVNNLENLEIYLEHDTGYVGWELTPEEIEEEAMTKIVINGGDGVLEGCYYITVDTAYALNLSPGQQKLYEILRAMQMGSVYTMTTIGKLAEAMGLLNPLAAGKRLEHLQTLGAISGLESTLTR
jgi:hypothetical protein